MQPVPQLGYVYNRDVTYANNIGGFYRKMKFHAKEKNIKAYFWTEQYFAQCFSRQQ